MREGPGELGPRPFIIAIMRRHSYTLLLLLLTTWAAPASAGRPSTVGFRAGLTEARLHGDFGDVLGSKYRPGFGAGAHARFTLHRVVSFQPEVWWVMKGAREDLDFAGVATFHLDHAIPYVEVPMLLRVQAPGAGA